MGELTRGSNLEPLHLADARPDDVLAHPTYCGRLVDEVAYWATPELGEHQAGFLSARRRCGSCLRSLERRRG